APLVAGRANPSKEFKTPLRLSRPPDVEQRRRHLAPKLRIRHDVRAEPRGIDAIGDDSISSREGAVRKVPGRLTHRHAHVQPSEEWHENGTCTAIRRASVTGGVKCSHVGSAV